MQDREIENEIIAKGLTAARVTVAEIDEEMARLHYESWVVPNTTTTIVVAVMPDGFVVESGKAASVSKANFNAEIGLKVAMAECERKARDKLWEMKGFHLREMQRKQVANA